MFSSGLSRIVMLLFARLTGCLLLLNPELFGRQKCLSQPKDSADIGVDIDAYMKDQRNAGLLIIRTAKSV
jgi:hypothetical protein